MLTKNNTLTRRWKPRARLVKRINVGFQASPQKPVELVKRTIFLPIPECGEGSRENVLSR